MSTHAWGATGRRPPLDPQLAAMLERRPELARSLTPSDIPAMRAAQLRGRVRVDDTRLRRGGDVRVRELTVPAAGSGAERALLVLRPADRDGSLPGVMYLHGGGMVAGDLRTGLGQVADWVTDPGVVVASLDYRLAPEHPHPAPVDDCYAGLRWLTAHREELGATSWILVGSSAGGGLAAGVALMARDQGGPAIDALVLLGPMLDDRNETASSHELHGDAPWDRESNLTGWTALLGDARGAAGVSAYAAPARAQDLRGLPPAFLDVGAVETVRDEVITFAQCLAGAGVAVELHVWAGAFHGFDVLAPDSRVARIARDARADYVRRRLGAELPG